MNKTLLSQKESVTKIFNEERLDTRLSAYEVFIEAGIDKEGNPVLNKDGSQRYYPVDESQLVEAKEDMKVRKLADNYFKPLFMVNGDLVEKVERENKRIYYCVDPEQVVSIEKGTFLRESKTGCFRVVNEKGYAIYDETEENSPRLLSVRKFETDNHKEEAENALQEMNYRHHIPYFK